MLLRHALGATLRARRTAQGRSLRDVARAACCAVGYLSEVERGRKEVSSELLASVADALGCTVPAMLAETTARLVAAHATARNSARVSVRASAEAAAAGEPGAPSAQLPGAPGTPGGAVRPGQPAAVVSGRWAGDGGLVADPPAA